MVIAAESLGIGSCYIGDVMENYETHRIAGPAGICFPIAMLCLGYYPDDHNRLYALGLTSSILSLKRNTTGSMQKSSQPCSQSWRPQSRPISMQRKTANIRLPQDRSSLFTGDGPLHPQSTGELAGRAALIRNHAYRVLRCLCQLLGHGCIV